jgi:hypothetical protein
LNHPVSESVDKANVEKQRQEHDGEVVESSMNVASPQPNHAAEKKTDGLRYQVDRQVQDCHKWHVKGTNRRRHRVE